MGLLRSIDLTGSARVRGRSCSKEPIGSWVPQPHLVGRDEKWPTIVMEIGVSNAFQKLRADAAWWLANSMGQVNLVLVVSIDQTCPEITFQTIVLDPESSAKRRYIPMVRQSVTTSRAPKQPDTPITTSPEEPLIIRFEEMCCRPPTAPESDIQISLHWLEMISRNVWMKQSYRSTDPRGWEYFAFILCFWLYFIPPRRVLASLKNDTLSWYANHRGLSCKIRLIWPISATVEVKICGIADQPQGPLPRGTLQK